MFVASSEKSHKQSDEQRPLGASRCISGVPVEPAGIRDWMQEEGSGTSEQTEGPQRRGPWGPFGLAREVEWVNRDGKHRGPPMGSCHSPNSEAQWKTGSGMWNSGCEETSDRGNLEHPQTSPPDDRILGPLVNDQLGTHRSPRR
ncbi:hypothetical protein EYF80_034365 [Liparis tanakae]|uniref:Uncharacterized protein n=1 Tax=Liparis tanakae TaxID=230148 RepID=A0A4Z2GQP2_9TELE|nr:hypothetical protein EYF80_034365 [Liparis tanakae]